MPTILADRPLLAPIAESADVASHPKKKRGPKPKVIVEFPEARDTLTRTLGRVEGMIKQRRSTDEQDWWVTWAATGGLLFGSFLALIGVAVLH